MADPLHLSLWFPSFGDDEMMAYVVSVLRQFPFSAVRPGVTYVSIHPVSWNEATIFERRFNPGIVPEEAASMAADLLHEDYAYVFEVNWDLWTPDSSGRQWALVPASIRVIAQGAEFDEHASEATGHIEIDFGLDSLFLQEQVELDGEAEQHVRANVHKLVDFTNKLEANAHANGRLLWSDSEDNLAQKLIARLQKVQ
jgi:hypothetical protein